MSRARAARVQGAATTRRAAEPAPFTWRGLEFNPAGAGFYASTLVRLGSLRTAEWKVQRVGEYWHARLRIGSDRFPGTGATADEALDAAADEARSVASFIRRLLPFPFLPARQESTRRSAPKRRSRKGAR